MPTFNQKFAEAIKSKDFGHAAELIVKRTAVSKNNSINNFISSLNRSSGMARTNKYEVLIFAPTNHPGGSEKANVNLHCNAISMPGHDLKQITQQFGSEPAREMVTHHSFAGNIMATFYIDAGHETKSWFDKWQEMTVNPITHKAQYYDDYKDATMEIYQLGADGKRTYGIRCEEVYPATISPIEYSYEASDIALLSVEFAYRKWIDIADLESGVPVKRTRIADTTEMLPSNGVLDANAIANGLGYSSAASLKKYLKGQV